MSLLDFLILCATLLCGLTAGFVFAFASVVMPGIGKLDDKAYRRAFQVIGGVIRAGQPCFGVVWLGSILAVTAGLLALTLAAVPGIPEETLETYGAPRWALVAVLVAAFLVGPKRMAAGIAEGRGRARETALWLELVDGLRPVLAFTAFLAFGLRWEARVVGLVLAQGGAGVVALVWLRRNGELAPPNHRIAPVRETLGFAVPAMLATLAYACYDTADRLVVTHFHGLEATGRYDLAYRIAMLTQTVNVVFRRSFTPLFYAAHARGDRVASRRVLRSTARRLLWFTLPLAVVVPAFLAVVPVFGPGYRDAVGVIPIVVVGAALWGIQMLWQQVLLAEGRARMVLGITGLGAAVNLALNLALVPRFAELGAAWATLASFLVMFLAVRAVGLRLLGADGGGP